jgi:hypothetical protein
VSAKQLRLVTEEKPASIELDAPEAGLTTALNDIAADLAQLTTVKRDVRSWALYGAAASSALTLAGVGAMFFFFAPRAEAAHISAPVATESTRAVIIAPAPVEAMVEQPEVAAAAAPEQKAEAPVVTPGADAVIRDALHLLFSGHARKALAELTPVLEAQPNNVDALSAEALALFDLHRDRAARIAVKKALALDPKHPMANVLRGFMAQVDHDVPQALRSYTRYLHQRPYGAFAQELSFVRESLSTPSTEDRHE